MPKILVQHTPPEAVTIGIKHPGGVTAGAMALAQAFGSTHESFSTVALGQLMNAACPGSNSKPIDGKALDGLVAAMHAMAPRDEVEGMLLAQMLATHTAVMEQMRRTKNAGTTDGLETNGKLAVKLLRTFTGQVEALQRYRGKGQQKVTVEHVHVHSGAQAIVGAVSHCPGGAKNED